MATIKKINTGENDILLQIQNGEASPIEVRNFRAFGGTVRKTTVNCPSFKTDDLDELRQHIEALELALSEATKLSNA